MERLGSLPPRVSVTRWEKESSPVIHSRTALQLLPSIRRRNYYITDVVVAASSAAAFDAATTTSNQPTLLSRTDARAAGRIWGESRAHEIASWHTRLTPLSEVAKAITGTQRIKKVNKQFVRAGCGTRPSREGRRVPEVACNS